MSDIFNRDICIRQGAEFREDFQRVQTRYEFEAVVAGTSAASAPTFPTALDSSVVDNTVTWLNKGVWDEEARPNVDVWLPSFTYARRARVVSPIVPINLTAYTGDFEIRATVDAVDPLYTGTVTFGTRANGEFSMVVPPADTKNFTFEEAVYDIELTNSAVEVDLVIRGSILLIKEVTRVTVII